MKKTEYMCDKCGRTIVPDEHYTIEIRQIDPKNREELSDGLPFPEIDTDADYCKECTKKVVGFLKWKMRDNFAEEMEENQNVGTDGK